MTVDHPAAASPAPTPEPAPGPAPVGVPPVSPEAALLPAALDGLLFVHTQPLAYPRLAELLGLPPEETEALVLARKRALDEDPRAGLQIVINEQGVQLATKACIAPFIQRLDGQKLVSLSLPALETLSVIAYKQPITKTEIEAIRGVNCDGVVTTLLEKKLIYVSGEKQVIGRPRLYSTTQDFLYYFGLKSLRELPAPAEDLTQLPPAPAVAGSPIDPDAPAPADPPPAIRPTGPFSTPTPTAGPATADPPQPSGPARISSDRPDAGPSAEPSDSAAPPPAGSTPPSEDPQT
ncbi:MAG: SMC-Scp complex subunit ScpB [Candidatus Riflebacteria bacterium]|nr:SMC-Scp complex subunit ScpB [Candidatus Riflebacteria bacterium]